MNATGRGYQDAVRFPLLLGARKGRRWWRLEPVHEGTPGSIFYVPKACPKGPVCYNFDSQRTTFPGGVRAEFPRTFPPVGSRMIGLSS